MKTNETNKTITITSAPSVYGRDEQTYWVIRKTSAPEYFSHIVGGTTYAHPFERATQFGAEQEADDFRRQKLGWMWETIKVVRTAKEKVMASYDDEPVLPCEA